MNEALVLIAVIRKPHGVVGELSADSYTFDNKRFKKLTTVTVKHRSGEMTTMTLESSRVTAKGILLKFKEVNDRDVADTFREAEVLIPESDRLPLPKGKVYHDEYPGMKVVDEASKEAIGTIREFLEMPAGNVLVIAMNDGTERLVTLSGTEVVRIERDEKTVFVSLLEELN
jgi:16S rRNA processing protein RimM